MLASWTLKIEYDGDIRRLSKWPSTMVQPNMMALREAAAQLFHWSPSQMEFMCLKYKDEDGDICTLTEQTIHDALHLAGNSGVLRFIATGLQQQRDEIEPPLRDQHSRSSQFQLRKYVNAWCGGVNVDQLRNCFETWSFVRPLLRKTFNAWHLGSAIHQVRDCFTAWHRHSTEGTLLGRRWKLADDAKDHVTAIRDIMFETIVERLFEIRASLPESPTDITPNIRERVHATQSCASSKLMTMQHTVGQHLGKTSSNFTEQAAYFSDSLVECFGNARVATTEQFANARSLVLDRLPEARRCSFVEKVVEVRSTAADRLAKAKDVVAECAKEVQPMLTHGFSHFKEQVQDDFYNTRDDMSCALHASRSLHSLKGSAADQCSDAGESSPIASGDFAQRSVSVKLSNIAATIVGAWVAGTLAPFRALRFATFATVATASNTAKLLRAEASTDVASASEPAYTHASIVN